jgi:two-component system chemotaxis response regulator CheB
MAEPRPGSESRRNIIVIGASAGGVYALTELIGALPARFPAAVFVVLHIGAHDSVLPALIAARSRNVVAHARDGEIFAAGRVYVAPPDHHLLLSADHVQLSRGPKEHHTRPAIDPLFRSAALAHGPRVMGVVLTGSRDDGTAGLQAIKQCGGLAIVQDPREAEYREMPQSALDNVDVDHCLPIEGIADALTRLVGAPIEIAEPAPHQLQREHATSLGEVNVMEELDVIGKPSRFTCPECNGALWEITDASPPRYRCHTGHGFSQRTLQATLDENTEDALWTAIRALQEKAALLRHGAEIERDGDATRDALALADSVDRQADTLRRMVEGDVG